MQSKLPVGCLEIQLSLLAPHPLPSAPLAPPAPPLHEADAVEAQLKAERAAELDAARCQ